MVYMILENHHLEEQMMLGDGRYLVVKCFRDHNGNKDLIKSGPKQISLSNKAPKIEGVDV